MLRLASEYMAWKTVNTSEDGWRWWSQQPQVISAHHQSTGISFFFLNNDVLFWDNCRFTVIRNNKERFCILFTSVIISHSWSTTSQSRIHSTDLTQVSTGLPVPVCVFMLYMCTCFILCNLITCSDSCDLHHSQKDPSCNRRSLWVFLLSLGWGLPTGPWVTIAIRKKKHLSV